MTEPEAPGIDPFHAVEEALKAVSGNNRYSGVAGVVESILGDKKASLEDKARRLAELIRKGMQ